MWPAADRYVRSAAGPLGPMGSRPARARADSMTLPPPQTWQRPRCALCHCISNIYVMAIHPAYQTDQSKCSLPAFHHIWLCLQAPCHSPRMLFLQRSKYRRQQWGDSDRSEPSKNMLRCLGWSMVSDGRYLDVK